LKKIIWIDILKKVVIVSRNLSHRGGVVGYTKLLIGNLSKEKFLVKHFTQGKSPIKWKNISLPLLIIHQYVSFRKLIKNFRPDIVHINPSFRIVPILRDSLYLRIADKLNHHSTLVMFHGWDIVLANKCINIPIYKKLFIRLYKKSRLFLVLSNNFKKQLTRIGIPNEKVKVVTTMYKAHTHSQKNQDEDLNKKIEILFMSRFEKSKGVFIAADVGKLLLENGYDNFRMTFAGGGPEYKNLMNYIILNQLNQHCEIYGYIQDQVKQKILERSDVFLLPSSSEGLPLVLLEAMGAGLAIVSTSVGAIPEVIKHIENGYILDSTDPIDFFEAVRYLIEDRLLLQKMQKANAEKAEESYEAKIVSKKIESIYSSFIEHL
jgi:glycosyltransferase involved in cell wall biosynthesis